MMSLKRFIRIFKFVLTKVSLMHKILYNRQSWICLIHQLNY